MRYLTENDFIQGLSRRHGGYLLKLTPFINRYAPWRLPLSEFLSGLQLWNERKSDLFRVLLTLYLIVVALLGPGLCCCAFGKFFAQNNDATTEEASYPSPCCHHQKTTCPAPENHQHNPAPSCPCKQHQELPVTPSVSSTALVLLEISQSHQGIYVQLFSLVSIDSYSASEWNSTKMLHLVQLSALDGLRAPFILLC